MKKVFHLALFFATFFSGTIQANSLLTTEPKETGNPFAVLIFIATLLYFIPSVIEILRKHHNMIGLIALNVFVRLDGNLMGRSSDLVYVNTRRNTDCYFSE